MNTIQHNLQAVRQQIRNATESCSRDLGCVSLLAVSKTKPVSAIEAALVAGQYAFGENYVQEGVDKIHYFADTAWVDRLEWHLIGPLQSNKSRLVAEHFHWVQTLDRASIAQRLNDQRPIAMPPLNVLIQINISQEKSKSGITPSQLADLADDVAMLPRLQLRGLMAIPALESDPVRQQTLFQSMLHMFTVLQQRYPQVDTLSMGMTNDMTMAIAAGSTMVRIGSAIFGSRDYR